MADVDSIVQAFNDSADYAQVGSRAKALAHQTACRRLLVQLPVQMAKGGRGGTTVSLSAENVRRALDDVSRWLGVNPDSDDSPGVVYPDFNGYRDL